MRTSHPTVEAAHRYLADLTPGADHALSAWSLGVATVRHCLHFAQYLSTGDASALGAESAGGRLAGWSYDLDRRGATAESARGGRITVRWTELAALVAPVLVLPHLPRAIRQALAERGSLTGERSQEARRFIRDWRPDAPWQPDTDLDERWAAVEVWEACRPTEQPSLFDL